ncbi:MAG: glycoside hydrolase/phage tail family protein [Cypionkella sp.]|nr:glycoside hydrolase/phage tail family protein [Cypionkella sp.]
MATILFAAAGAALGSGFGGTLLGLSGAVIGRAVGATLGRVIDQRLLGGGSEPVEVGRLDRLHLMGAGEGAAIPRIWGKMRLPGQVIWASPYREVRRSSGGGKGAPQPRVTQFSYSVSLAIGLCEGEILGVGRIWADGKEVAPSSLNMRVYRGSESQMPDPVIGAWEGDVPAFRGLAYVVMEELSLEPFGNRVPQFSFEVMRKADASGAEGPAGYQDIIRGVAVIPGTGEYSLATQKVRRQAGLGVNEDEVLNQSMPGDVTDFPLSLQQLTRELPSCRAAALVVSWFGDDLRAGFCKVKPKIAQQLHFANDTRSGPVFGSLLRGVNQTWRAGGIAAAEAERLPEVEGRAIYGGTPGDAAILQGIRALQQAGQEVMFYPFVLMEQMPGNVLPNPYADGVGQPAYPWRGRITLANAPGRPGSADGTFAARAEVAAFFGQAQASHFQIDGETITYSGPEDWGYRRFILHYAHLCAIAGGVESFCIGSELRGLSTIMAEGQSFPAVEALVALAQDVRAILGPGVKISYASDWSEYFGFQRGGDVHFHLDPLWAHPAIDFIGIDNYMPLSDWRDGSDHADAGWESIYALGYLAGNVLGGEGYDWFYDGPEGRQFQLRRPIRDSAHGEDWVFRYKDLPGWWGNFHHPRLGGIRASQPTAWVPGSKPIRFTEYGCPAVDKGTNEPNKFFDPKSSESAVPHYSTGERDDVIQMQYFRAMEAVWSDVGANPVATVYEGRMLDLDHCYAWSWDARPYPAFPRDEARWADGPNWRLGHWLNGRATAQPLDRVVGEICAEAGVASVETARLHGLVAGYAVQDVTTARSVLQPLGLVGGFDAVEEAGALAFVNRGVGAFVPLEEASLALDQAGERSLQATRLAESEAISAVRLGYVAEGADHGVRLVDAMEGPSGAGPVSQSEYSGLLPDEQAQALVQRWLVEATAARDAVSFRLPPSRLDIRAGRMVALADAVYRVDRVEVGEDRLIEATRIEPSIYALKELASSPVAWSGFRPPGQVLPIWLDIPLVTQAGEAHAPHLAVEAAPWPGQVAVWRGESEAGYSVFALRDQRAVIGLTETMLESARPGLLDRGTRLLVRLRSGALASVPERALLSGANLAAVGSGDPDDWEVIQFAQAELVSPGLFALSGLLRGQVGSDGSAPANRPEGSVFVLLNDAVQPMNTGAALRGVEMDYRIGDASQGPGDPDVVQQRLAFRGNGLRPYAVCHLRATRLAGDAWRATWVRRTRQGGDGWDAPEVPLGEEREEYLAELLRPNGTVARQFAVTTPLLNISAALVAAEGLSAGFTLRVAQVSALYGPGPWRSLSVVP